jgi:hypothetical protein
LSISTASVQGCDATLPSVVPPVAYVDNFGAKGDGVTDDFDAITRAIQSLSAGGTVVFSPGKIYVKKRSIRVDRAGVILWGYGATIYAVVTDDQVRAGKGKVPVSVNLEAPGTGAFGLTIVSNLRVRLPGHPSTAGIYLKSSHQRVVDSRIEYTGVGIFVQGTDFLLARNVIYRTTADGIHITNGAGNGRVVCNVVRQTGDDMIAIVNFGIGSPTIGNFLIEGNDVAEQYWGRGITVVGGRDVTIRNNRIAHTPVGAGVLLNSESAYKTADVENIVVEKNWIEEVQTSLPQYNPRGAVIRTGQGAVDVNGQSVAQRVSRVMIRENLIRRAAKDGVFIRGNSAWIGVVDNQMSEISRDAVRLEGDLVRQVGCARNRRDGEPVTGKGCSGAIPVATGAALDLGDGRPAPEFNVR